MYIEVCFLLKHFICFCDISCSDVVAGNEQKEQKHISGGDIFNEPDMAR